MGVVLSGSLSGYVWLCVVYRLPKAYMGCVLCVCGSLSGYVVPIASAAVGLVCMYLPQRLFYTHSLDGYLCRTHTSAVAVLGVVAYVRPRRPWHG